MKVRKIQNLGWLDILSFLQRLGVAYSNLVVVVVVNEGGVDI